MKLARLVIVLLPAIVLNSGCKKEVGTQQSGDKLTEVAANRKSKAGPTNASDVEKWLSRWDESVAKDKGPEGLQKRQAWAEEAVKTSGGGAALGRIIVGLNERRDSATCDWLIENGSQAMFTGKAGEEARKWLNEVTDTRLKERLCFKAGYYFSGPGFKEYLAGMSPASLQSRLLTGYCCGIAESEPVRGMDEFANLRPKDVSYGGLKEVVAHFPEDADFPKIGLRYGDDFNAANSLAKSVRGELLKRWAKFHPEAAGKFVMDNPKLVAVDQMANVIVPWLDAAPEMAVAWVAALPSGGYRDAGYETLAKHYKLTETGKAWQYAGQVGDSNRRVEAATAVFKEWEKWDREAATKAWAELFPEGK